MNAKRARSSRRGGGSCSVTAARNLEPCAGRARPQNPIPRRNPRMSSMYEREKRRERREKRERRRERRREILPRSFCAVCLWRRCDFIACMAWCSLLVLWTHWAGSCLRRDSDVKSDVKRSTKEITRLAFASCWKISRMKNQLIDLSLCHWDTCVPNASVVIFLSVGDISYF